MSDAVVTEFQATLHELQRRCHGDAELERRALFLLALEREQLVAVAYGGARLAHRVHALDVPAAVKDLIDHALAWATRDEEMHAIYVRGALLKLHDGVLSSRAWLQQLTGAVAGWSAALVQHAGFAQAPLSLGVAHLVNAVGVVAGKVPRAARSALHHQGFRDFCRFNVDAEHTASLSWRRLTELARDDVERAAFRQVQQEEDRHAAVFQCFVDVLTDDDRLQAAESADTLAERLRAAGEEFLPRALRHARSRNPTGAGGTVFVGHDGPADDRRALLRRLLHEEELKGPLRAALQRGGKVAVKASFMMGYDVRDRTPLVDTRLLDELAHFLRGLGATDVCVLEARNHYDHFYRQRSVAEVARYFGVRSEHFRVVDASDDQVPCTFARGLAQHTVAQTWAQADVRISFGKLTSHPCSHVQLTLANLDGLGARVDEHLFAERQADRDTALMMLLDEFPVHLALLDAYDPVADGLVGVMGTARPVAPRRLYAALDPLSLDVVAARHVGIPSPQRDHAIAIACHWFDDPRGKIEVSGTDEPIAPWRGPFHSDVTALLSVLAYPVYVFGSGRGALFVPDMDTVAFPALAKETVPLMLARRGLRRLLGFGRTR